MDVQCESIVALCKTRLDERDGLVGVLGEEGRVRRRDAVPREEGARHRPMELPHVPIRVEHPDAQHGGRDGSELVALLEVVEFGCEDLLDMVGLDGEDLVAPEGAEVEDVPQFSDGRPEWVAFIGWLVRELRGLLTSWRRRTRIRYIINLHKVNQLVNVSEVPHPLYLRKKLGSQPSCIQILPEVGYLDKKDDSKRVRGDDASNLGP